MQNIIFWQYCLPILGFKDVEPIKQLSRLKPRKSPKPKNRKRHKTRGQMVLRIPDMLVSIGTRSAVIHHPAPSVDNADLLAQYALTRDKRVRDRLVRQNLDMVRAIAHAASKKTGHSYEDLEQVGCFGLLRAIDRFDLSKGYRFSTFAYPLIKGDIAHYIRDRDRLIRLPKQWHYLANKEKRVREQLGAIATDAEIRLKLGLTLQEWQELQVYKRNQRLASLDMRCTETGDRLGDLIADSRSLDSSRLEISFLLEQLEPENREAIAALYLQELRQKEAAAAIGCNSKAIARRAKEGLEQLRAMCG